MKILRTLSFAVPFFLMVLTTKAWSTESFSCGDVQGSQIYPTDLPKDQQITEEDSWFDVNRVGRNCIDSNNKQYHMTIQGHGLNSIFGRNNSMAINSFTLSCPDQTEFSGIYNTTFGAVAIGGILGGGMAKKQNSNTVCSVKINGKITMIGGEVVYGQIKIWPKPARDSDY